MPIFRKNPAHTQRPRDRSMPIPKTGLADGAMSIIAQGMIVEGDIVTEGIVRIEGELRGTIRAAKAIILGPTGRVEGDLLTEDALIGGTVAGTIVARQRLELQSTCCVTGEIHSRPQHLKLDEGARFSGEIRMVEVEEGQGPHAGAAGVAGPHDYAAANGSRSRPSHDYDIIEESIGHELGVG